MAIDLSPVSVTLSVQRAEDAPSDRPYAWTALIVEPNSLFIRPVRVTPRYYVSEAAALRFGKKYLRYFYPNADVKVVASEHDEKTNP